VQERLHLARNRSACDLQVPRGTRSTTTSPGCGCQQSEHSRFQERDGVARVERGDRWAEYRPLRWFHVQPVRGGCLRLEVGRGGRGRRAPLSSSRPRGRECESRMRYPDTPRSAVAAGAERRRWRSRADASTGVASAGGGAAPSSAPAGCANTESASAAASAARATRGDLLEASAATAESAASSTPPPPAAALGERCAACMLKNAGAARGRSGVADSGFTPPRVDTGVDAAVPAPSDSSMLMSWCAQRFTRRCALCALRGVMSAVRCEHACTACCVRHVAFSASSARRRPARGGACGACMSQSA
jgi:hypothetical protein